MDREEDISQVSSSRGVQPATSTSFSTVQPLQKRTDHSPPRSTSYYRPHTYHDQDRPSHSSNVEDEAGSSVVLRSTELIPSSPLLKSTVSNPLASGGYHIQADPTSPYYIFQDTRLIPNPIVRIVMENATNSRMFSLQNISPDTLSLLFRFEFVSHLVQFAQFLPVAKLQAIILGDTSGTFVHPCVVLIANAMGCHLHQDNRLDYSLNHLELLHLNTVCQALEEMDRSPQREFQPRFHIPGQTGHPLGEEPDPRMPGEIEDPFTYAQIRYLLFLYALLWRSVNVASRLLRSVFYIVERNDLRFVPEYKLAQAQQGHDSDAGLGLDGSGAPLPEFSESDYERVVFLSSLIGADAGLQLFGLQRRAELSWLELERQFFDELPVVYPTLAQMPLVWRDRGLLLLNHATSLQNQYIGGRDVIQSCKDLINSHFFAIDNLPTIIALHEGDREGQLVLRCAAIISHTAMAVFLRTLSQALSAGQGNPAAPPKDQAPPIVYRRRCRKSLKEAIKITKGLADADYPFIEVTMQVCWFQISKLTAELDNEDVATGISPERESPPPSIPPASKSPTIRSAEPVTRANQIRQQQAQYQREHQRQQRSPPTPQPPPSSSASVSASASPPEFSRDSSASPPHQATISEFREDQTETGIGTMPSIDEVAEELSDVKMLDKCIEQLKASFWRQVPDVLTNKMHRIFEGLKVVMENQEGVYVT